MKNLRVCLLAIVLTILFVYAAAASPITEDKAGDISVNISGIPSFILCNFRGKHYDAVDLPKDGCQGVRDRWKGARRKPCAIGKCPTGQWPDFSFV